jgi:hypothetical protein
MHSANIPCLLNARSVNPVQTAFARERFYKHVHGRKRISSCHMMAVEDISKNRRAVSRGVMCALGGEALSLRETDVARDSTGSQSVENCNWQLMPGTVR